MADFTDIMIDDALTDPMLLGAALGPIEPWRAWLAVLKAFFALPLTDAERATFQVLAGGRAPPETPARELWCAVARRGGKTRIASAIASYLAVFRDYKPVLAPGEIGYVALVSQNKDQARVALHYIRAFFEESPVLRTLVEEVTQEEVRLKNGITIAVAAASFRSVRGRAYVAIVADEIAFWRSDESSMPDREILRALRPALLMTKGPIIGISSPYAKRGVLYEQFRDHYGKDSDHLVIKGDLRTLNPTVDEKEIERHRAGDPEAAVSELDGEFRGNLTGFIDEAVLRSNVEPGVRVRPFQPMHRYIAGVDTSGGQNDSFVLAIAHKEGERVVLDLVKEWEAPFDPVMVVEEAAALLKSYRITAAHGDAYAAQWVVSQFKLHEISYRSAGMSRSEAYLQVLPKLMGRNVMLLDHPRMVSQFATLQRRTNVTGRDTVDHVRGMNDDVANAVAIVLAKTAELRGGDGTQRREAPTVTLGHAKLKQTPAYGKRGPTVAPAVAAVGRDPGRKTTINPDGTSVDTLA